MKTRIAEGNAEELRMVSGGSTFDSHKYRNPEYADAGIKYVSHFIARNEFWWRGNDIGHDNANAVVRFCQANDGRQPASLEEAILFEKEQARESERRECELCYTAIAS